MGGARHIKYNNSPFTIMFDSLNSSSAHPCGYRHVSAIPSRKRIASHLCGLIAAGLLGGCTTAPYWETQLRMDELILSSSPEATPPGPEELPRLATNMQRSGYRIGPQDELTVTIWGSKEMWSAITAQGEQAPQTVLVQDDGSIVLPLLKPIRVEGLPLREILTKVAEEYRKTLGELVQVDGKVSRYRARGVLLDGAFSKPGIVYLSPDLRTLGEAVTAAGGGLTADGDPVRGMLYRGGKRYRIDYRKAQEGASDVSDIALQAGDRIFFPSRNKGLFYVFGEVGAQGGYPIPPDGISLLQGLAQARGPAMVTADMGSIFLIRNHENETSKVYQLTMKQMMDSGDIALSPGDRLFVPPTNLANWDRTMRQLLPLFSGMLVVNGTVINPN